MKHRILIMLILGRDNFNGCCGGDGAEKEVADEVVEDAVIGDDGGAKEEVNDEENVQENVEQNGGARKKNKK